MPTVHYINMNGANGTGAGTSQGNERNTLPAQVAGDVWSFQRGSTWDRTAQQGITVPLAFTSHGDPTAPKPVFSFSVTASSTGLSCSQDAIFHEVAFKNFQPASNAGTALNLAVRGGGAINTGPGAGALLLNVDFDNIKGNAVQANINDGSTPTAASDFIVALGCTFNNIGDDAFFVKARYVRLGWCDIRKVSQLTATGDCFHNMDSFLEYAHIHDSYFDHTDVDTKQCVMLDDPTAGNPGGLAVIERNVFLGAGTNVVDTTPSAGHNPVNSQMRTLFRQNYVRTKRIGLVLGNTGAPKARGRSEIIGNVFDVMLLNAAGDNTVVTYDETVVENNTFVNRGPNKPANGVALTRGADSTGMRVRRNLFSGFGQAILISGSNPNETPDKNAFHNNTAKGVATTNDVDLASLPFPGGAAVIQDFRPSDARLFFASFDRQNPDFFGRYAPAGIGYIGACLGAL